MKLNGERVIDKTINLILIIIGIVSIYPIWFVLIASVSSPMAISAGEVVLFPKGLNIDAYKKLFAREDVWIGYRNSIFYTSLGTMINLVVQMPLAYALSRKTLPGRTVINTLLVITMYFSGGIIPSYLLISKLGLHDTVWALALPGAVSVYNVIVAKNFFAGNVPESLHDAACIDGCGYTHFFCRVVLPLSKSIMAIIAMFSIQGHWNSYLEPRMYLRTKSKYTLQQVVQSIAAA
ncbi:MAG: carbohydrate ABC transporter permease, partial [Lachnospiraceae bacterium]|nr:carbohydrate ABC transporter permease [Lachnospiraceae bacterium]